MVSHALQAAETLRQRDISVRVVNVSTIKPLDAAAIWRFSQDVRFVVTAEEHSVIGGLGDAVSSALALREKPIVRLGIQDQFGTSAACYEDLLCAYHLMPSDIVDTISERLGL